MGGCLGTLVEQAESMGLAQVNVPGEQGTFAPHSDESFGCLDVWVGDAKADGERLFRFFSRRFFRRFFRAPWHFAARPSLRPSSPARARDVSLTPAAARAGDQLAGR